MSRIVDSCRLTNFNGGLSQLHFADDEAVGYWLIATGARSLLGQTGARPD